MPRSFYVYILASRSRTLYVGMTGDLTRRVTQHKAWTGGFTAKYKINRLVYVEETPDVREAIFREKQIKSWSREKKLALVAAANPGWIDLADGWAQV